MIVKELLVYLIQYAGSLDDQVTFVNTNGDEFQIGYVCCHAYDNGTTETHIVRKGVIDYECIDR